MTHSFTKAPPAPDVVYARRILAEAAALARDGQLGGAPPDGVDTIEARRVQAEVAAVLDFYARVLISTTPKIPVPAATRET